MLNIGPAELVVVLVVALIVLGPTRLPDAARSVGRAVGELRRATAGLQAEMRDAFEPEPPAYPAPPAFRDLVSEPPPAPPAPPAAAEDRDDAAVGTEGEQPGGA